LKRLGVLLLGTMLFSSVLASYAYPQEPRRLGMNTTFRTFREEVKSIEELGVGTIRVPLQWKSVKISPGEYDWSTADRLLSVAQTKQMDVLFNICTTFRQEVQKPRNRRIPTQLDRPSKEKEEWVDFVKALASRYRGQGVSYEIENEVNEGTLWKRTLDRYLELLKAGYEAIKKADPKARVLPSAMGCGILRNVPSGWVAEKDWKWHDSWLQRILSAKDFDVVNIHNYYFPSEIVANGLTFQSYLEHIRDLMMKSGSGDRPIWITETGFVSLPSDASGRMDDGSYEKQAAWLTKAYQQAFNSGVERIYWLLLRDRKEPYFGSMGLMNAKGDPRPAWNAFREFSK